LCAIAALLASSRASLALGVVAQAVSSGSVAVPPEPDDAGYRDAGAIISIVPPIQTAQDTGWPRLAQSVEVAGDSTIGRCEAKSYTISVHNDSGEPMTDLVITALLENLAGFSYVGGTSSIDVNGGAFCSADPTVSGGYSGTCLPAPHAPYLTWDIDAQCPGAPFTLDGGDTLNVTFELLTDCTAVSGSLFTYIEHRIGGSPLCDNTGAHSIRVLPGNVTIRKTSDVSSQALGRDVTWTLAIENTGIGTIENVLVTDVLGDGLAYVSSTPPGDNSGQTTTWDPGDFPGLASMDPGEIFTIDLTATVVACDNLDNEADVRWGCDMVTDCYNTAHTIPPSTARASLQRIARTPHIHYTPPDITFDYCTDQEDVAFTITNDGDGAAHDAWIYVDFGALTVSSVSAGAIYDDVDKRFELTDPVPPSGSYDLSFTLNHSAWCGGFHSGDLVWQTHYKDECDNDFFPPVQLSAMNSPAGESSLSVSKSGAPEAIQIGAPVTYSVVSSYSGALTCGDGTVGAVTVVDAVPDGFTVLDVGGGSWVPGDGGTGGTVTWTYTPPASLNTSVTLQAPDATQCYTYCHSVFTNAVSASATDCCGCALTASDSQTTAIECEELVDSEKTADPTTGVRCNDIEYTNTYVFADNAALDGLNLSQLVFQEDADNEQEYVPGSLAVTLSGVGDVTACAQAGLSDTTPGAGGNLVIDFANCSSSIRNRTLTISYHLTITEDTVGACDSATFHSWSSLDLNLTSDSGCLEDGQIHETAAVSVDPPAMSLSITGPGRVAHRCETQTITIDLTQSSNTADPRDVRLVLSGLNYHVVDPAATVCSGAVAPVSCTPTIGGSGDYMWEFGDAFTGSGQSATLQLDVQKRCTGSGDLVATAYFDDNCNDDGTYDDTCSTTATEAPALLLSGDLLIEKTPEVYSADTNTVQWTIYLTNRGTGTAYNVWFDDELGAGLDYVSAVVDDLTGVTITADQDHDGNAINGCTIDIVQMAAGERREIALQAHLIDCDNLTNDASASWGCIGVGCQTEVTDSSVVQIPRPLLINATSVATPVDACSSPAGSITLRNAGPTAVYNLQVTEDLPAGLTYILGSTRWRINDGGWNGPNAAYDPNPTTTPLQWTSTEIPGLAECNVGDIIEIEFQLEADCPFAGGDAVVGTSYENPCGQVFNTASSVFTVDYREPDIAITKTRIFPAPGEPIACGQRVEWEVMVANIGTLDAPVVWVEDTMDPGYSFVSSAGGSDGGFNGYGGNPLVTTWEIIGLGAGQSTTLNLTADSLTSASADCEDVDNVVKAFSGCAGVDGSSATKPGVDPPDNLICLSAIAVQDAHTGTRRPELGFRSIDTQPGDVDSCNDSTQVTIVMENTGPVDAYAIDLAVTLPDGILYTLGTAESGLGTDEDSATEALEAIADPGVFGSTITFDDLNDKGDNLAPVIQADGNDDTLVLRFAVQSACYVTDDMDFDLRFYSCCDDAQYSETTQRQLSGHYPVLAVTKVASLSQVDCGGNVEYTVQVTNSGAGNAEVVRVVDTLGDWLDYAGGSFSEDHPGTVTPALIGGDPQAVGWEFNNLGPGATATFGFEATLNPDGLPNHNDCTAALRQNNVTAQWACGVAGDAIDDDPNTTGYDCTDNATAIAGPVTLEMPNLVVASINPTINCHSDGSFGGSISVTVQNQGDGYSTADFGVSVDDGQGWSGVGTHSGAIAAGGSADVTIDTGTWAPDCHPCAAPYRFSASVDTGKTVCECDESDNDAGPRSYTAPIPDLLVTDIDFSNVTCANDGVSGTVEVTISNNGCATATDFEVGLATNGCLHFSNATVPSLAAENSTTVSFPISGSWADCTVGDCDFTATVDPSDAVCECDGTNNERIETYSATLPDLVVTDIDFDNITCANDDASGNVQVTVQNQGYGTASDFDVRLQTDGCLLFSDQTVASSLSNGDTALVTFTVSGSWAGCSDCGCDFAAVVDVNDNVCECDGTNNQLTETYNSSVPDLRVNSVTPSVTCGSDGNLPRTVTVNVENVGCSAAKDVVVRLTSDCGISFADQTVSLSQGASQDVVFNYTSACSTCECTFTAEIDPDDTTCECDGTNNSQTSAPFTATVPDIEVQSDTLAISPAGDGSITLAGAVTLVNDGCGSSLTADVPMRFTLFDNTGCGGNQVTQWTQTFTGVNLASGGGTQVFAIAPQTVVADLCASSTNCQVSIRVEADHSDSICECDGTDNTYCADNKGVDIPDLRVGSDTLGVSCASDGQVTVSGSVTLVNNGCGSNLVSDVPLRFTLYDGSGCGGNVLGEWTETLTGVNVPSGGGSQAFAITSHGITTDLVSNSSNCQVSLRVEVDYVDAIPECDGTDNIHCADNNAVDLPDLEVFSDLLHVSCLGEGQATIAGTVTMANHGCGSNLASNIPVRFTLYDDVDGGGSELAQWTETLTGVNVPAGGGTQVFDITPQDIASNLCTESTGCQVSISVEADYSDTICESDDRDNTWVSNETPDVPDLMVNSVTPSVTCVADGDPQGTVTVDVENIGCGNANDVVVRLTSDCGVTFADQTISLGGGSRSDVTFNYPLDCGACTCAFTATVNPAGTLCECDGTNNTAVSAPFTATVPDIEVQSDTLAISPAGDGSITLAGAVTLVNNGCGSSLTADVPMRFTLFDNTGCGGNQVTQWTQTFTGVNLVSGGGTQVSAVAPQTVVADLCADSTDCQVSIQVEADYSDSICECDGTDNTYCADGKAVDIPDLRVGSDTLGVSCASDGQVTVSGSVSLVNDGCGPNLTADIPMRFTLFDNTTCGGNQLAQWTQTFTGVNLASGGGSQAFAITPQSFVADLCADSTNCRVSIRVEADYSGSIWECDGTDNVYCADNKAADIPDLQVGSDTLGVYCTADGQVAVSGTLTMINDGCGSDLTDDIPVRFTVFDGAECGGSQVRQWIETLTSVSIPSGGGSQVFAITPEHIVANLCEDSADCRFSIRVEADHTGAICECEGTDNVYCAHHISPIIPDLTVNRVVPFTAPNGDGSVTVSVSNTGCGDANDAVVRVASDCGLSFADRTVDLASGSSADLAFYFAPGGACTFDATIDPDKATCECDGANNAQSAVGSAITIVKDAISDGPQDFHFAGDLGAFKLDDDPGDVTLPHSRTFVLPAATYTVTETPVPGGWNLAVIACDDPDGDTTADLAAARAVIDLDTGEHVTCIFTNTLPVSVTTATGTGVAILESNRGVLQDVAAVSEETLACSPEDRSHLEFVHGFFSFRVTRLIPQADETVVVSLTLPSAVPVGSEYWKCLDGRWLRATRLLGHDDGDNLLTLTLTDGGLGDLDGVSDGVIVDGGGPGQPPRPVGGTTVPMGMPLEAWLQSVLLLAAVALVMIGLASLRKYT
jgi:uncharacterized repeat protein (TIGR01451 family)